MATLSDDADQLAKLWDEQAVRLQSGSPVEIGKAAIYINDKRWQTKLHGGRTLSYKPDLKDLQIVDGWAFEWGTFEVRFRESEHGSEKMLHGKVLRVLKKTKRRLMEVRPRDGTDRCSAKDLTNRWSPYEGQGGLQD